MHLSEDGLEGMYDACNSQNDSDFVFNERKWVLNVNTKLQTKCESSYKENFEMNIVIYEEKDPFRPPKPLLIDPNKWVLILSIIDYINLMFSGLLSIMYSL
jgi:hypothetical protein